MTMGTGWTSFRGAAIGHFHQALLENHPMAVAACAREDVA
jgi:hypothetical protein